MRTRPYLLHLDPDPAGTNAGQPAPAPPVSTLAYTPAGPTGPTGPGAPTGQPAPAPTSPPTPQPSSALPFNFNVNVGGQPVPPTPIPAAQPPAEGQPRPTTLVISEDEFKKYQTAMAEQLARLEKAETDRIKAVAEKEGIQRGLEEERKRLEAKHAEEQKTWQAQHDRFATQANEERQRIAAEVAKRDQMLAEMESRYHGTIKSREIGDSLAGVEFVSPTAAKQARALLEPLFTTKPAADGTIAVVAADDRPAAQVIAEALASADYAHFLKPGARGGVGARGTATRPVPAQQDPQSAHLAELEDRMKQIFAPVPNGFGRN
jgi:hypothetical protein